MYFLLITDINDAVTDIGTNIDTNIDTNINIGASLVYIDSYLSLEVNFSIVYILTEHAVKSYSYYNIMCLP